MSGYSFTDRVRRALQAAREEGSRLGHEHVGTEHILLGIIRDGGGVGCAVLRNALAIGLDELRAEVEKAAGPGQRGVRGPDLPYTSRAKKVLELSMSAAREFNHNFVGTEHLLLGLIAEERGIAAKVLELHGLTLSRARQETERLLAGGLASDAEGKDRPDTTGPPPRFTVQIDDASDRSVYEQIVAQIQEAVATRRLRPGDRLPTVRELADRLDIAPGTVARAYGELERLGVVVTEGARGTRVAERSGKSAKSAVSPEALVGLLRPVVVAAFHLGAGAESLRSALEQAMRGIYQP